MSQLEKLLEEIEMLNTPTSKFVKFIIQDKDFQNAKGDTAKWKEIMIISQRFDEVFKNGEYDDLRKIFKDRYPNL